MAAGSTLWIASEGHAALRGRRLGPEGTLTGQGTAGGGQQQSGDVLWPGRRRRPRAATPHRVPARVRGSRAALLDLRVAEARLHQPHGHALTYTPPPSCQRGGLSLSPVPAVRPRTRGTLAPKRRAPYDLWLRPHAPVPPWSLFRVPGHAGHHCHNLSPRLLLVGRRYFLKANVCRPQAPCSAKTQPPALLVGRHQRGEPAPGCWGRATPPPARVPIL